MTGEIQRIGQYQHPVELVMQSVMTAREEVPQPEYSSADTGVRPDAISVP